MAGIAAPALPAPHLALGPVLGDEAAGLGVDRLTEEVAPHFRDEAVAHVAPAGDLAVRPLAPLGVLEQQRDGAALVRAGSLQAMITVGGHREKDGVAMRPGPHHGLDLVGSVVTVQLVVREDAMMTIPDPAAVVRIVAHQLRWRQTVARAQGLGVGLHDLGVDAHTSLGALAHADLDAGHAAPQALDIWTPGIRVAARVRCHGRGVAALRGGMADQGRIDVVLLPLQVIARLPSGIVERLLRDLGLRVRLELRGEVRDVGRRGLGRRGLGRRRLACAASGLRLAA